MIQGYKIGLIENLGSTLNQFDTIDFTDNDIRRLDGFPFLPKIKSLLFSNNKIQ
jgi:U2 small nuclear ribonucleoprotein A'